MNTDNQDGFSLLELTIATTIMLFVIMIGSQVLLESQRLLVRSNREFLNNLPSMSLAILRADIYNAQELTGIETTPWVSVPMVLKARKGTAVYTIIDGGCLEREWFNQDHISLGARCVLRDVQGFSWRFVADSLIEVRVEIRETEEPSGIARLDEIRKRKGGFETRAYSLSAYGRGSRKGRQWW